MYKTLTRNNNETAELFKQHPEKAGNVNKTEKTKWYTFWNSTNGMSIIIAQEMFPGHEDKPENQSGGWSQRLLDKNLRSNQVDPKCEVEQTAVFLLNH